MLAQSRTIIRSGSLLLNSHGVTAITNSFYNATNQQVTFGGYTLQYAADGNAAGSPIKGSYQPFGQKAAGHRGQFTTLDRMNSGAR
jgi:hypothetical protein